MKDIRVITMHPDGDETDNREFDTIKEAREWVRYCGRNEEYWNRSADRDEDRNGWAKENVSELRLMVNGECVDDWVPKWRKP